MLGCAAVVTVPAVVAVATAPVTFAPWILDRLLPLPIKKLAVAAFPKLALPEEILPVTPRLVNVPTEVIFGCAAVYTVPATRALPTCPDTLAPATAFAVVANATAPVTFAPVIELSAEPLPDTLVNTPFVAPILPTFALPVTLNAPAVVKLPPDTLPVAVKLLNVPTLVMFG